MLALICLTGGAFALRAILSLHSYSGYATPPKYGDFEAQRHWQEITVNLPISEWYTNSSDNDLMYWGLDYPPLTAYHSWLMGLLAHRVNPNYTALHKSRGITTEEHKAFMRSTVLLVDLILYIPALLFAVKKVYTHFDALSDLSRIPPVLCGIVGIFYPGQILIDNGHFQYNNASLGLACLALGAIFSNHDKIASILFALALNYKQMELYHALPFFFYLLARCFFNENKRLYGGDFYVAIRKLATLGFIVITTFAIVWAPWLTSAEKALQTLHRIFPVARGVFEDKVSNVWCIVNIVYKFKDKFSNEQMAGACLLCTLFAVLPSCLHLLFNARKNVFLLSLINTSLAFFLFSFQVHEKSILLVTIPVILQFQSDPLACIWFLQIATFSMFPLLVVDNLIYAFIGTNVLYLLLIRITMSLATKPNYADTLWDVCLLSRISDNQIGHIAFYLCSIFGTIILCLCLLFAPSPTNLPHIYSLLIAIYSCCHFVIFFIYFNYRQFTANDVKPENMYFAHTEITERRQIKKFV